MDFLMISLRRRKDVIEVYPKFIIPTSRKSTDLMIRGGDFYAVWLEDEGLWSTDEGDALRLIDRELDKYVEENRQTLGMSYRVMHMWDAESGMIDSWHKYCQKQLRDSFHMLDEKLIFSNTEVNKKDYASKRLNYPLEEGDISAYDRLMSVLYSEEERHKIEWAIGSIVSGESKTLQKFMVLYGAAGTGKSTVLNIIQLLFDGYYAVFDAKSLGSANAAFALEPFKANPLVAIQHDGDLSRIEDNTRLNSLVSHEIMTVNEKFKSAYANRFKAFLFMGTNKPVKITDAKSGLLRRLIDVTPSGNKLSPKEYRVVTNKIAFELGAIAYHCRQVFLDDPDYYDDYIPVSMLGASNDFYNFVLDSYHIFKKDEETTGLAAWKMYKEYCEEANISHPYTMRVFIEELKNYFRVFEERGVSKDGTRARRLYSGFRSEIFDREEKPKAEVEKKSWIQFDSEESILDQELADCFAQYANDNEKPSLKWVDVTTKLSDIDPHKLHYVKVPLYLIVIDFDLKDDEGNKSFERNLEEASKWPATYAELSKSGAGIHLHYIYKGDVSKLSYIYAPDIEIKSFPGNSSLRRKLTRCNTLPIATISSGLPLKGEKNVVNFNTVKSEKGIRNLIKRNLNKEIHPATKPSVDFIFKILEDAYASGIHYDVSDMRPAILAFAASSTNQSEYCIKRVAKMRFQSSDTMDDRNESAAETIIFYDVEVFPNLFIICWKADGVPGVHRMINPSPASVEDLMQFKLVGFNCRRYDNHILYARLMGYNNEQLYKLSQKIIVEGKNCFFGEAYNVSYTDIYDFAAKKQSLKKWEIELGIHHKELGLPWDEPVPEELWETVAAYCDNDVIATEAVYHSLKGDFTARQILADVADMSVNDTTNSLTTRIIFGKNKKPQTEFNYRNMGDSSVADLDESGNWILEHFGSWDKVRVGDGPQGFDKYTVFDRLHRPIFPGYKYDHGKSTYRGEEVGEGGYVYSEPGIYTNVALLDIASMHPSSIVAENLFGDEYTQQFKDILQSRIAIKHKDFEHAKNMLGGKLAKYLDDESAAKELAQALKIAINSVYGLTSAKFDNPFRDIRNVDNIVAKRGALFMINLKHEVQKRGFTVAHIKTDSIKIPNATPEIIEFVMNYGRMYGYNFEHEATYDRMCLVNDAVYIAKYNDDGHEFKLSTGEKIKTPWTATGTQFQIPYVFKTLFAHAPLKFRDRCESKSVTSSLYLDMNEDLPDVSALEKEMKDAESKYKKGLISDLTFEEIANRLTPEIAKGHNYIFVGRVGEFCPIKKGCGGGLLMREKDGKYYAATGSKDYRWLESEFVQQSGMEDSIDERYYISLVNDAIDTINKYGNFESFVSDDPYATIDDFMNKPEGISDEVPF